MLKRTLYIGNPAYLSVWNSQLKVSFPDGANQAQPLFKPIEDLGMIIIDNPQVTLTSSLMQQLEENNTAVVICNAKHLPSALFLPMQSNTLYSERTSIQLKSSLPLRKQLWQQTVAAKIRNQAGMLIRHTDCETGCMLKWCKSVRSGDPDNLEARAAVYYWKEIFRKEYPEFFRDPDGSCPNNLLNYGYAILRAIVARELVATGLTPVQGIFHHNKYNAYCLADDIMEPYRPYVDDLVMKILPGHKSSDELSREDKALLLSLPQIDVKMEMRRNTLQNAVSLTCSSLWKCYNGESRTLEYPVFDP